MSADPYLSADDRTFWAIVNRPDSPATQRTDAERLAAVYAYTEPIPARSPLGTALAVVFGALLMTVGIVAVVMIQPSNWATFAASISALGGFAILARLYDVSAS